MLKQLTSLYIPAYPKILVYMLQSTEYQPRPYLAWLWRTKDFTHVIQRRTLEPTKAARLLLLTAYGGILLQILVGLGLIYLGIQGTVAGGVAFGVAAIVAYPLVWSHALVVPLLLGRWFVSGPAEERAVAQSEQIFAKHGGHKIAVVGSYGKTTMKEILNTVLSEGLNVAATPANKNVSSSHAKFAQTLKGDEDALIIEYGEGAPGDVARFAQLTHPTHAVITGLAPAHLDQYKTLQAAGEDIFSVAKVVPPESVFVNKESSSTEPFIASEYQVFDRTAALGWKVSKVSVSLHGTNFTLSRGKENLQLESALVGEHQVGFLAFAAALALELGLSKDQVVAGVAQTKPFEHRMQPYPLGGAWVIDDTYNGNLEGIRAGTSLLKSLKAKRKIYVTPGLVDQGEETKKVHIEVGKLVAAAKPDLVVLMQNSVTQYIQTGLKQGNFAGEVKIEDNPLDFYTNLNHFVAKDDLVVMQNDWTDNYA